MMLIIVGTWDIAEARIFRFGSESLAGYFAGTGSLSSVGDDAYAKTSGADTVFDKEPGYNYSGEVGLLFNSQNFAVLFGIEFLSPQKMQLGGLSSGGTKYMDMTSNIRATILKMGSRIAITSSDTYRSYISGHVGYAMMSLENTYELTAAGQTQYSLPANLSLEGEANVIMGGIGMGIEFNIADTSTMSLEGGYRYLPVSSWEHKNSGTGFNGAYTKGDNIKTQSGEDLETELSGMYIGIGFQIYIN